MFGGWKTYICAGVLALATFAKAVGWIDSSVYELIIGIVSAGGLAALRAGVAKNGN